MSVRYRGFGGENENARLVNILDRGNAAFLARAGQLEGICAHAVRVLRDLEFQIEGTNTVVLLGQVTWPPVRSDAESAVKRVEGVAKVVNKIEVLPVSPFDDRIRMATFRAIYSRPALNRYILGAVPAIHIIVKNGNVTLTGVVASQSDMTLAEMAAKGVPGVFRVTNNLRKDS